MVELNDTVHEHGGRLRRAAEIHGVPLEQWLDLSTGISPHVWPVPPLPQEVWQRLPEEGDGLQEAMHAYFGTSCVLALPGSQAAIQALPRLCGRGRVGIVAPTYAEHAKAWRAAGHTVLALTADALDEVDGLLESLAALVVVNPNNPTGDVVEIPRLLRWRDRLARHEGHLVVDEAFVEASAHAGVARFADRHLVVLRSLGKFWGLAGLRVGFVLAAPEILRSLRDVLGPWPVSHPARWIARHALLDHGWMEDARARLRRDGERLTNLLGAQGLPARGTCDLFRWVRVPRPDELHAAFARRGLLIRAFIAAGGVRFGLPGSEAHWRRLEVALSEVQRERR